MNKCADKFCPECGHHLYRYETRWGYFCAECKREVKCGDAQPFENTYVLRAGYDAEARRLCDEFITAYDAN
jgi:DNA-directed RNA polymerase subunit M/transcription elongation factor TFIIS